MPHHGEGPHDHDHDHDHDEGIVDKAADALGLDDDRDDTVRTETTTGMNPDADLDRDREGGWAGVPEALGMPETLDPDPANRPAGPDYAADDRPVSPATTGEPTADPFRDEDRR